MSNSFDQNDFFVCVNAPFKDKEIHIPIAVKQTFQTFQRTDPSFSMMPFDHTNKSKNDIISKETLIPNEKRGPKEVDPRYTPQQK